MSLPPHVEASLGRFRAALEARFGERVTRLVLFGSHARGDADEESDVDVLVVIHALTPAERRLVIDLAHDADAFDRESWAGLSPIVMSTDRFAELQRRELLLARDIERDGVPL